MANNFDDDDTKNDFEIKNQTITGNGQQFADKVINQNRNIDTGVYQEIHHHHSNESKTDVLLNADLARLPKPGTNQFIGRSAELAKLNAAFNNRTETGIVAIIADDGIGKSALIDKWINDLKKNNYDDIKRVFAWSFYSQGSQQHTFSSSHEFFAVALPFFGFADELPKNDDDKARALAKCLQNQAGLLILDGLEPLQQPPHISGDMADAGMREFLEQLHLHRHPQSFVLISSRQPIIELNGRDDYLALPLNTLHENDGAALLQALAVQGTTEECQAVSRDLQGHALSLVLLASLLKQYKRGDIRYAKELPPLDSDNLFLSQGENEGDLKISPNSSLAKKGTERVLSYYNDLLSDNERRFMHCLALFDRPMFWKEKEALFIAKPKKPTGLKKLFSFFAKPQEYYFQPLSRLSGQEWQTLQDGLEAKGLLLKNAATELSVLPFHRTQWDTHPLIRQFFARQFQSQQPQGFQQAHFVLFEYFQSVPDKRRLNLTDLNFLYRAVVHGCLAGEYQTALNEVYINRILRRGSSGLIEYYSHKKLCAYSQNLIALSAFFPQGWSQPGGSSLTENTQAWLLSEASFCLMSLGRLAEAVAPREKTTELYVNLSEWRWAEMSNESLIDLLVPLGRLAEAKTAARQAIDYVFRTDDKFRQIGCYSKLATVLHRYGRLQAARQAFAQAEQLQQEYQPDYPYLYPIWGAQYCALLLDIASNNKDLEQVLERGKTTLKWHENARATSLLDISFQHLTLARTYQALQQAQAACAEFDLAIQGIQEAKQILFIPQFYLTRADFYLQQNQLENAVTDLKTAQHTIQRCGMKLYTVDYALLQARYHLTLNQPQHAKPFYEQAEMLISETGYHLRDKALAELRTRLHG